MEKFKNINTLIFDFGGVIINLDKARCIRSFKELGFIDIDRYLGDFIQSGIFLKLEKGELSPDEFRSEIKKLIPEKVTDEQINKAWNSFLAGIPTEKMDMLLELKKKFKLLLLSNTNSIHKECYQEIFIHYNGLPMSAYFDKMYVSYEMGLVKPDPLIFQKLISDSGITPSECLFLDDGVKNIEAGQEAGFQTYLVEKNDNLQFLLDNSTWQ